MRVNLLLMNLIVCYLKDYRGIIIYYMYLVVIHPNYDTTIKSRRAYYREVSLLPVGEEHQQGRREDGLWDTDQGIEPRARWCVRVIIDLLGLSHNQ